MKKSEEGQSYAKIALFIGIIMIIIILADVIMMLAK